jgi:hypothetical protein
MGSKSQFPTALEIYKAEPNTPRVYYSRTGLHTRLSDVLHRTEEDQRERRFGVCVIEDISADWKATLVSHWNIDPQFFSKYSSNAQGDRLWESVIASAMKENFSSPSDSHARHIEGVIPYLSTTRAISRNQRRFEHDRTYGWQSNARISYYQVSEFLGKIRC